MLFYDRIYFRVSRYYVERWDDDLGFWQGILVLMLLIMLQIGGVASLIMMAWEPGSQYLLGSSDVPGYRNHRALIVVGVVSGILCWLYGREKKYEQCKIAFENETATERRKRDIIATLFVVITLPLSIWAILAR
jgi:hypothetical protein